MNIDVKEAVKDALTVKWARSEEGVCPYPAIAVEPAEGLEPEDVAMLMGYRIGFLGNQRAIDNDDRVPEVLRAQLLRDMKNSSIFIISEEEFDKYASPLLDSDFGVAYAISRNLDERIGNEVPNPALEKDIICLVHFAAGFARAIMDRKEKVPEHI